ncbi:MAG: lysophospholipid acyltransferase family protein [Corynebacterium sp.]|nr:lysophospholipid acyltransferase family protein [Corynebacterium sp.]
MDNKTYALFKNVIFGPFLRIYNRPEIAHLERIPATGPAILASSHQSVLDSFFLPLLSPRQITFLAKKEYFEGKTLVGKLQKWFFTSVGQVPVDRESATASDAAIVAATRVIDKGDLFGIYPEGTRSPDGRVYRGHSGVARIAYRVNASRTPDTAVAIIPIAMIGSRDANPIGSWILRPAKVRIVVCEPINPLVFAAERGLEVGTYETERALTDHIMAVLAEAVGAEYVDVYASTVKKSLAAGEGYPPGAEPGAGARSEG